MKALNVRFGNELHYDPMFEVKNLTQLGTVQTYLDKFDQLLNKVSLFDGYIVSFFLSGLKNDIRGNKNVQAYDFIGNCGLG